MKFRAIANTELLVSETALALDAPADTAAAEQLLRVAYDEGVNLFLAPDRPRPSDRAFEWAFSDERRAKVHLAFRLTWTGDFSAFAHNLDDRLAALGAETVDVVIVSGVSRDDLQAGAVGDAVHRLRASGRIGHAALRAGDGDAAADARLIERNGFGLMEEDVAPRIFSGDDKRPPLLVWPRAFDDNSLAYLWNDAGRTAGQLAVQFALAQPGVCAAFVSPSDAAELKELARAPLAPPLSPEDLETIRGSWARSGASHPVEA